MDLQRIGWAEYMCLYAASLDLEEWDQYRWWINSQLETKKQKWKWADVTKGGSLPLPLETADWSSLSQELKDAPRISIDTVLKTTDKEVLKLIEKDGRRLLYKENDLFLDITNLSPGDVAVSTRNYMVIRA